MPTPIRNIAASCQPKESVVATRMNAPAVETQNAIAITVLGPKRSPKTPKGMLKNTAASIGERKSSEKPTASMPSAGITCVAYAETWYWVKLPRKHRQQVNASITHL